VSANLPATLTPTAALGVLSAAVAAHDGPVPSSVRKRALAVMEDGVDVLEEIAGGTFRGGTKVFPGVAVAAVKLLADIAAVRSSASVPRDIVDDRNQKTAAYLRSRLGEATYATMADDLAGIWDI
jgi:hypothetical protein